MAINAPATSERPITIGSFALLRRLPASPAERPGIIVAEAAGRPETPFAERSAILRCFPAPPAGEADPLQEAARKLISISHPHLVPVLEAGVQGTVVYAAEARPDGVALTEYARGNALPPATVARIVADLAAALTHLHSSGLSHGRVTPASIWIDGSGRALLSGLVPAVPPFDPNAADPWGLPEGIGAGLAADQYHLALTATQLITGREPTGPADPNRVVMDGVAERIAVILRRGLAIRPDSRFPSVVDFSRELSAAVAQTGEDLIAAVWEALAREDRAMANLMIGLAERCAPDHKDLPLLRLRLQAGAPPGIESLAQALGNIAPSPAEGVTGATVPGQAPAAATPAGADQAAIAALLTPPVVPTSPAKRSNPWITFAAGFFGCIALLVLLIALSLAYS